MDEAIGIWDVGRLQYPNGAGEVERRAESGAAGGLVGLLQLADRGRMAHLELICDPPVVLGGEAVDGPRVDGVVAAADIHRGLDQEYPALGWVVARQPRPQQLRG